MDDTLFCSRVDCGRPAEVRGYCRSHYQTLRARERRQLGAVARECLICGSAIVNTDPRARYCSKRCKDRGSNVARQTRLVDARPVRLCASCGKPLPRDANGRRKFCSDACAQRVHHAAARAERLETRWAKVGPCRVCGGVIPRERTARAVYCSDVCRRKAINAARSPHDSRRRLYGLEPDQYEALVVAQGGRCAVCGTDQPGGRSKGSWHVDHEHSTGRVRGLLCTRCNQALGLFDDDAARLVAAAEYLTR